MKLFISFLSAPASARPLAALRLSISTVLFLQAFLVSGHLFELYGNSGFFQGDLNAYLIGPLKPRVQWFTALGAKYGMTDEMGVTVFFLGYVVSLSFLAIGWRTRLAAVIAWFTHFILILNSGHLSSYGADAFSHVLLFYFMFMAVGDALSLDSYFGTRSDVPSAGKRLWLRLLQTHVGISYLTSGIAKAKGASWWNGEAIWRAVHLPEFQQFDLSFLAYLPWVTVLVAWGTLIIEMGYPFFIWPRQSRKLWICLTVALHLSIILFLGLLTFSLIMISLTVCLFRINAEPSAKLDRERRGIDGIGYEVLGNPALPVCRMLVTSL